MIKIHALQSPRFRTMLLVMLAIAACAWALPAAATATAHSSHPAQTVSCPPKANSSANIVGELWVVSDAQAESAQFPPPTATPDAQFCTEGITYIGNNHATSPKPGNHCWTIANFLGGCTVSAYKLTFSGQPNPNLGNTAATGSTPLGSAGPTPPAYGTIQEFTGNVNLTSGQQIMICHDDGVSLEIDGTAVSGFNSTGVFSTKCESATWTGSTGTHTFALLYANWTGSYDSAWIQFFPRLS